MAFNNNKINERFGFYIIVAIIVFVLILGWMKRTEKEKAGFQLQGNKNLLSNYTPTVSSGVVVGDTLPEIDPLNADIMDEPTEEEYYEPEPTTETTENGVEKTVTFDVPFPKINKFARKLASIPDSDRMSDINIDTPKINISIPNVETYYRFMDFMKEINTEPNDPNDKDTSPITATGA